MMNQLSCCCQGSFKTRTDSSSPGIIIVGSKRGKCFSFPFPWDDVTVLLVIFQGRSSWSLRQLQSVASFVDQVIVVRHSLGRNRDEEHTRCTVLGGKNKRALWPWISFPFLPPYVYRLDRDHLREGCFAWVDFMRVGLLPSAAGRC